MGDERTWGCEAPYFNFGEEVEVGDFKMHSKDYCTVRTSVQDGPRVCAYKRTGWPTSVDMGMGMGMAVSVSCER